MATRPLPGSARRRDTRGSRSRAPVAVLAALAIITGLLPDSAVAAPGKDAESSEDAGEDDGEDAPDGDNGDDEEAGEAGDASDDDTSSTPESAGMGGNVISADDPDAQRAQAELEGTSLSDAPPGVPERMEPLQAAAWWTLFGTFALATTGGLFVGLSQVQQDNANRLTMLLDDQGNAIPFTEVEDDYNAALSKGDTYDALATGFLVASGATLIASIALFGVHGRRKRLARNRAQSRLQLRPGGLEVRF